MQSGEVNKYFAAASFIYFSLRVSTDNSGLWVFVIFFLIFKRDCPLIKEHLKSPFLWECCAEAVAAAAAGYQSSFTAWPEKAEIPLDHLSQ